MKEIKTVDLDAIKRWRFESTVEEASVTFISRVDDLIEVADAAQRVVNAWQKFCEEHPEFDRGFEDHRAFYDLAEVLRPETPVDLEICGRCAYKRAHQSGRQMCAMATARRGRKVTVRYERNFGECGPDAKNHQVI